MDGDCNVAAAGVRRVAGAGAACVSIRRLDLQTGETRRNDLVSSATIGLKSSLDLGPSENTMHEISYIIYICIVFVKLNK